jgi:hypothetical protein
MRTIDLRRKLFIYYVSTQESAFVAQGHQSHKLIYIKKKIRPSSSNIIHFYRVNLTYVVQYLIAII